MSTTASDEQREARRKHYTQPFSLAAAADAPPVSVQRKAADLTPYLDAIDRSWQKVQDNHPNPGMAFTIPADAKQRAMTHFRQAAEQRKLGVSFAFVEAGTKAGNELGLNDGELRIIVQARLRREKAPNGQGKNASEATKAKAAKKAALPAR